MSKCSEQSLKVSRRARICISCKKVIELHCKSYSHHCKHHIHHACIPINLRQSAEKENLDVVQMVKSSDCEECNQNKRRSGRSVETVKRTAEDVFPTRVMAPPRHNFMRTPRSKERDHRYPTPFPKKMQSFRKGE